MSDACHVPHLGVEEQILIIVRLVYKEPVNAELLKGHYIVLASLVVQLVQLGLQGFPGFLHLLDGVAGAFFHRRLFNRHFQVVDLLLNRGDLTFS